MHAFILNLMNVTTAAATEAAEGGFNPENFIKNLGYMGSGMLGIFVVIGIIVTITYILNGLSKKK